MKRVAVIDACKAMSKRKGEAMFEVAEAYERMMGRWSRRLATLLNNRVFRAYRYSTDEIAKAKATGTQ